MGGGGFTMEGGLPSLDAYILALADVHRPRVLFMPTASGDPEDQIRRFGTVFGSWPCRPRILSLFQLADLGEPLEDLVLAQDIIYVGGGSMVNLLALWRAHELPELLVEANRRGTVLAGLSAGAMCWMEGGVSRSTGKPTPVDGLGLIPGSLSVHARQAPERGVAYRAAVASGRLPSGWTADDHTGLLFVDGRLEECVASRPDAEVRRVDRAPDGSLEECPVRVRRLEPHAGGVVTDALERRAGRRAGDIDVRDELRLVNRMRGRPGRASAARGGRRGAR